MTAETESLSLPSVDDVKEMEKLMSEGKRNYVCNQPHLALDSFVELCEKLSKFYGQESDKCVEAYLYYGKTLLDVARIENGVLGHAIKEMPVFGSGTETEDQETEKECNTEDEEDVAKLNPAERRTCVERAMREDNLYNVSTDEQTEGEDDEMMQGEEDGAADELKIGGDGEKEAGSVQDTETVDAVPAAKTTDGVGSTEAPTSDSKENNEKMDVDDGIDCEGSDEDNDDVSNLELAWEMLELTSVICKRQLEEEGHDKRAIKSALAEAKYGLAQISLEAGRYEDSVNDFRECLELYKDFLDDKNERVIAEGYYNIALALCFDKKYVEAIEGFEKAVSILKARVNDLECRKKSIEEKEERTDEDNTNIAEWKDEIQELNDLIFLDMMTKIEDAQEAKSLLEDTIKAVKNTVSGPKGEFDAGFSEETDAPLASDGDAIHDCSSNIKSVKRKSDEGLDDTTNDKKVKQTESGEVSSTNED